MSRDALIVGINRYDSRKLANLKSPANDAGAIAKLLRQYGNFSTITPLPTAVGDSGEDFTVGKELGITQAELEEKLAELFIPKGTPPDMVLFYFSGHGLRKEVGFTEGYLATSDADPEKGLWGLSLNWLRRLLQESPVRQQVIWLDCCYSGELLNFDDADPGDRGRGRDRCFIAASREYQLAYEETDGQHGVLTHALLNALNPENQPANTVDNHILVAQLEQAWKTGLQSPLITNCGGQIILTRSGQPASQHVLTSDGVCPYRGLQYFDCNEEDPKYFYGRTALTDQLLEKVRMNSFIAVLGPSGSGKSSVVRAGLLHQLKMGHRISGSETWPIHIFRPGEKPLENLARAFLTPEMSKIERAKQLKMADEFLADGANGFSYLIQAHVEEGRLVLVIDQFEEIFTLCRDMKERQRFFETVLGGLARLEKSICLILTMRADFFGKCAEGEYSGLSDYIQKHLVTVTPMNEDELRQAIEEPARKSGLTVQPELVPQMIGDVKNSPGSLPLLQYSLTELWNRRNGNELTLTQYSRMSGVKGTLAKQADEVYGKFSEEEQQIARRIFIQLTQLGEGTEDTRRQVEKANLIMPPEKSETVEKVIQRLADAKLIVTSEVQARGNGEKRVPVVDVAHEALIRHWPMLRTWVDENREDIRFHRRLDEAARYWEENGKPEGLLWRLPDLERLEKFHQNHSHEISQLEIEFFQASISERERVEKEKEAEKRKRQALLAQSYWSNAVYSKMTGDILPSLHYAALAGKETTNRISSKNYTFDIQFRLGAFLKNQIEHDGPVRKAIFNKDESLIQSWSTDGTVRLWDSQTGTPVGIPMKQGAWVEDARFTKDEKRILSRDHFGFGKAGGNAYLWDAENGSRIGSPMKHDYIISGAVFSHDESQMLTWDGKGTVKLWNIENSHPALKQELKHGTWINGAVFSQNSSRILTWGGENIVGKEEGAAILWNAEDGALIGQPMTHEKCVNGAVFCKNESRILTWSKDGTIRFWDADDGSSAGPVMKHEESVRKAILSKDEDRILTYGDDNTARLWDTETGKMLSQPMAHNHRVIGVMFNKDESRILTWSHDGTICLWEAESGTLLGKPMEHDDRVTGVTFTKDEKQILTKSNDGTARLWNAETGELAASPMRHGGAVYGAVFNHNESQILTWSADGTAQLWDAKSGSPITNPMRHDGGVYGAAFYENDNNIMTWGHDGKVRLWEVVRALSQKRYIKNEGDIFGLYWTEDDTRLLVISDKNIRILRKKESVESNYHIEHNKHIKGCLIKKDQKHIYTYGDDSTVRLWDIENGSPAGHILQHSGPVNGMRLSKDESLILTWTDDGIIRLWYSQKGSLAIPEMRHDGSVKNAVFYKDESRILTWGGDGFVRLWDAKTGSPIGNPMKHKRPVEMAVLNKDETLLLTWSDEGVIRFWNGSDGTPAGIPVKYKDRIRSIGFCKNDEYFFIWGVGDLLQLWNTHDRTFVKLIPGNGTSLSSIQFYDDSGKTLMLDNDGIVHIWDMRSITQIGFPIKHDQKANGTRLSYDNEKILTWSKDGTARLWDSDNGAPISRPMKHYKPVTGASFSMDRTKIITKTGSGMNDTVFYIWEGRDGSLLGHPINYPYHVGTMVFSRDTTRICVTGSSIGYPKTDGNTCLLNIEADYDFPQKHLPLLVEVCTGTVIDDYGNVRALTRNEWETRREKYIAICEEHLKTCEYKSANIYLNYQKPYWNSDQK